MAVTGKTPGEFFFKYENSVILGGVSAFTSSIDVLV